MPTKVNKDGTFVADPLDLDTLLKAGVRNRIARIGVEIEGGWVQTNIPKNLIRDGSVFKEAGDDGRYGRAKYPGYAFGEVALGPIQPVGLATAIKSHWPSVFDKTCGLHVHMSFRSLGHYQALMDPRFVETIHTYLLRWAEEEHLSPDHTLWSRLRGESIYCQKKFWPDAQILKESKDWDQKRHGHRYTSINYCWRGGKQKTIECRLLPLMETPELSAKGVQRVLDLTNAALLKLIILKDRHLRGRVEVGENDGFSETVTEII